MLILMDKKILPKKMDNLDLCYKQVSKDVVHLQRSSLIRAFPVCYSDKHCVNSRPKTNTLLKCLKF